MQPDNHEVQKFDTRKIYQLSNEGIFLAPFFFSSVSPFLLLNLARRQCYAYALGLFTRPEIKSWPDVKLSAHAHCILPTEQWNHDVTASSKNPYSRTGGIRSRCGGVAFYLVFLCLQRMQRVFTKRVSFLELSTLDFTLTYSWHCSSLFLDPHLRWIVIWTGFSIVSFKLWPGKLFWSCTFR